MPKAIKELADKYLTDPAEVSVTPAATTVERIEQSVTMVNQAEKTSLLAMSLPIIFRRTAKTEFDEAADWYEARRDGLGLDFIDEVERVLRRISDNPPFYPAVHGDTRVAFSRRGGLLACGSNDRAIHVWRITPVPGDVEGGVRGTEVAVLRGQQGLAYAVAFGPDGAWVAAGYQDGHVGLWEFAEPPQRGLIPDSSQTVAFLGPGHRLVNYRWAYDFTESLAPVGKTYEAWVIDGDDVAPAGTFGGGGTIAVKLQHPVHMGSVVAVTVERRRGKVQSWFP